MNLYVDRMNKSIGIGSGCIADTKFYINKQVRSGLKIPKKCNFNFQFTYVILITYVQVSFFGRFP